MNKSKYNPELHHRRSIRLKGHDYAGGGLYFVTMCAHRDAGNIFADAAAKAAVEACWKAIPQHFPHAEAKDFVVMPDHVHGIIRMAVGAKNLLPLSPTRAKDRPRGTSRTLGSVVRGFKIGVTKWFRHRGEKSFAQSFAPMERKIWQRDYYEIIVRSPEAEKQIAEYIQMNPWRCVQQFENGLRGIGNPTLWNAKKLGVLCSRNAPHIGRLPKADIYFGGWHSPKEKEILEWLLEQKKPVVACFAWDLETAGTVPGFANALQENRLLILEMRNRDGDLAAAEQRNRFVIEHSDELFVPHTTPGGMLEKLLKECQK